MSYTVFNYKKFSDNDFEEESDNKELPKMESKKDLLKNDECKKYENVDKLEDSFQKNPFGFDKTLEEKEQYLFDNVSQISISSSHSQLGAKVNSQESLAEDVQEKLNETTVSTRNTIIINSKIADRYKRRSNELPQNQYQRLSEKTNIMESLEESELGRRRRSSIVNLGQRLKKNVSKIFTTGKSERRRSQLQESLIISPRRIDTRE